METNIKWYSIIELPEALTLRETDSKLVPNNSFTNQQHEGPKG